MSTFIIVSSVKTFFKKIFLLVSRYFQSKGIIVRIFLGWHYHNFGHFMFCYSFTRERKLTFKFVGFFIWDGPSCIFHRLAHSRLAQKTWKSLKTQKKIIETNKILIVSLHTDISDTAYDPKSPQPPEEGVLNRHKHKDGHCKSMIESAQWSDSVKICKFLKSNFKKLFVTNQLFKHQIFLLFYVCEGEKCYWEACQIDI